MTADTALSSKQGGPAASRMRATALLGALLAAIAILFAVAAPNASAMNVGMMWSGGGYEAVDEEMEAIKRSGASALRYQLNWGVQALRKVTNPGDIWGPYDKVFQHAWERGIRVNPYLYGRLDGSGRLPQPSEWEPQGSPWETWIYEVVQRYGHGGSFWAGKANPLPVITWEIWNEPNAGWNGVDGKDVNPGYFARFLQRTSNALAEAQAPWGTTTLFGGLLTLSNGTTENGEETMTTTKFLTEAHAAVPSLGNHYTAMALHPYAFTANSGGAPANTTEVQQVRDKVRTNIEALRSTLNSLTGTLAKSIWVNELGWPVDEGQGGIEGEPNIPYVPPHIQAELIGYCFNMMRNQTSLFVSDAYYYNYRDIPPAGWAYDAGLRAEPKLDPSDPHGVRVLGIFRPAWTSFQQQTGAAAWPVPPGATTMPQTNVQHDQATLRGDVNPNGLRSYYRFQWGTSTSYGNTTVDGQAGFGSGSVSKQTMINGLTPNTTYHYRFVVTNQNGETGFGSDRTFKTPEIVKTPTATTEAATGVTESGAKLRGNVNPNGLATTYQFEYGTTTAYGSKAPTSPSSIGSGTSGVEVSETIGSLAADTTYHFRVVATNAEGTAYGADKTFKTSPPDTTAEDLAGMAVIQPFNGSSASRANFNSNWGKLGWAAGKGEDTTSGWRPVAAFPTVQGAFSNVSVSDEKGAAAVATMAANPGIAERYFSLWLDMGNATVSTRSGYELRFTYVSANNYSVNLSKWSGGTQTALASKANVTFANGNSLAFVDKGSSVSGWINTGSGYSELLGASDSTFSSGNAGVQGAGNISRLVDFKVGSLLPNTTSEPGTSSTWNLRNSNSGGSPDMSIQFGVESKKEVVGDWNGDGTSTIGTFSASTGIWKLRNSNGPGPADVLVTFGGGSFSTPIVGDWNGDGIDTIGAFNPSTRDWRLRNSNLEGPADKAFQYGGSSSVPVSGDWDGIGADGIGVFYPNSGNWHLRHCICGGNPDYAFQYGGSSSKPIVGNWDAKGADGIGVYYTSPGHWHLRHCMCGGNPDYAFQYGGGPWTTPVTGDWNGNGADTIGVVND